MILLEKVAFSIKMIGKRREEGSGYTVLCPLNCIIAIDQNSVI